MVVSGVTARDHERLLITGPRSNAVLVGEEDWNSIQETLYLLSVPGMRESIREGLEGPVEECNAEDRTTPWPNRGKL
ncbi:MAG: type II toxin-antitoxin system Phd/YefM family antitoxin [Acidobacteriota bacterium]|nr:type II toxin-antitoxin system Phd/YefM family antitoxin [Acidobacteriota bacterium]